MRNLLYFFCFFTILTACDDGDIIDIQLDFDKELELCGSYQDLINDQNGSNFLLYDVKTDPNESLTLLFPVSTANTRIFNPTASGDERELQINTTSIKFNYRTYSGNPELILCQEIPDASVSITNDYETATGAVAIFTSTFLDDDNDGIPSADEDLNENGDYTDDDTDADGIPNYIDADDDNDNVLTIDEDDNTDEDNNPYTNPRDTDSDGILDYLDNDDDGDMVLTHNEDEDLDGNLKDDYDEDSPNPTIPRFLNVDATEEFENNELNANNYTRTVTVVVTIENANLTILNSDLIDFGTYTNVIHLPEE